MVVWCVAGVLGWDALLIITCIINVLHTQPDGQLVNHVLCVCVRV